MSCHDDTKLNSLLGKNVQVEFWDGKKVTDRLGRDPDGRYRIDNVSFYKTHIKRVREVIA